MAQQRNRMVKEVILQGQGKVPLVQREWSPDYEIRIVNWARWKTSRSLLQHMKQISYLKKAERFVFVLRISKTQDYAVYVNVPLWAKLGTTGIGRCKCTWEIQGCWYYHIKGCLPHLTFCIFLFHFAGNFWITDGYNSKRIEESPFPSFRSSGQWWNGLLYVSRLPTCIFVPGFDQVCWNFLATVLNLLLKVVFITWVDRLIF